MKRNQGTAAVASLRELVEACAYVKPFAGEILSEGENVTVKNVRHAMRFCNAVENAQKLLEQIAEKNETT